MTLEINYEVCPFCGNDVIGVLYNDKELGESKWHAVCYNCGAHGPYAMTASKAYQEWNNRNKTLTKNNNSTILLAEETVVECIDVSKKNNIIYKCLNCGQYMHKTSWSRPVKYCSLCGKKINWDKSN